jgi:hypothetical protein
MSIEIEEHTADLQRLPLGGVFFEQKTFLKSFVR